MSSCSCLSGLFVSVRFCRFPAVDGFERQPDPSGADGEDDHARHLFLSARPPRCNRSRMIGYGESVTDRKRSVNTFSEKITDFCRVFQKLRKVQVIAVDCSKMHVLNYNRGAARERGRASLGGAHPRLCTFCASEAHAARHSFIIRAAKALDADRSAMRQDGSQRAHDGQMMQIDARRPYTLYTLYTPSCARLSTLPGSSATRTATGRAARARRRSEATP